MAGKALKLVGIKRDLITSQGAKHASESLWEGNF